MTFHIHSVIIEPIKIAETFSMTITIYVKEIFTIVHHSKICSNLSNLSKNLFIAYKIKKGNLMKYKETCTPSNVAVGDMISFAGTWIISS